MLRCRCGVDNGAWRAPGDLCHCPMAGPPILHGRTFRIRVVFLDIDGVVNTPMWTVKNGKRICQYNFPEDVKTNNWQAMQWVSEFVRNMDIPSSSAARGEWTDLLYVLSACAMAG